MHSQTGIPLGDFLLVYPFAGKAVGLAKACGLRRWLTRCIEMGYISKGGNAEGGKPCAPLLGINGCDRAWCGTKAVPQHHRRYAEQMRQKHAGKPKVAKECNRIAVGGYCLIVAIVSPIAVLLKERIKVCRYALVFRANADV